MNRHTSNHVPPFRPAVKRLARAVLGTGASFLGLLALASTPQVASAATSDDYVVMLRAGADAPEVAREERKRGNQVEEVFDSRVNGLVADLEPRDVRRLRLDQDVVLVERDAPVRAFGTRDSFTSLWGLDRIDQRALPLSGRITTTTDGSGVKAYIIDTGIRADHVQFENRVAPNGFTAFSDGQGWNDCHGHGTHVGGTVAGKDYGVAPKASLVAVRVLDCNGSGSSLGVIAGIDWVASDHPAGAPAVANLSLGGGSSPAMNLAIQRLFNDGVSVAVAAGNSNADACDYSPASAPEAITVGATTSTDARASFSNFGSCLDIFAPGAGILSATQVSRTSTASWSGTSMASPHVAGAAALLLSGEPGLAPAQVANRISAASTTGRVTAAGTGSLNRLLFTGVESTPNPSPEPAPEPAPAPPGNDGFSNAVTLSSLGGTSGSTVGATREAGEPDHGWGASRSVWYRWTAPSDGSLVLDTQGSGYDTVLAAYSGQSVGSLVRKANNDDNGSGGLWSRVTLGVSGGVTYSIAIDGYSGAVGSTLLKGSFTPTAPPLPPPEPPAPPAPPSPPVLSGPDEEGYLTFSGAQAGESYLCRIGSNIDGPLRECESPFPIPLDLTDGEHRYRLAKVDGAGNRSPEATGTFTVTGSPAPVGDQSGLSVNGGAAYTSDPEVTLDIVWPTGTRSVLIANDGSFDGDEYPVSSGIPWTLATSGAERLPKLVYLKFIGPGGVSLGTAIDDIILDQTAPVVGAAELIGKTRRAFRVRVAARDTVSGVAGLQFSDGRQRPRARSVKPAIRSFDGGTVVVKGSARPRWYRASDRAGNWSAWRPVRVEG